MGQDSQLSPVLSAVSPGSDSDPIPELFQRINTLNGQFHEEKQRAKKMQQTLDQILLRLSPLGGVQASPGTSNTGQYYATDRDNQTPPPYTDTHNREQGPASRESLLKNAEIPVFDGEHIYGWLSLVERYFRIGGFSDLEKLDLVSVHIAGDVLGWFNWEVNRLPFANWFDFKDRLLLRFGNLRIKGPSQSLFCIKQLGTVQEYVRLFEDLSTQVSGLDDHKLEGIFLNGLRPEMQELVYMMKPQSLPEMVAVALSMESSALRRIMQKTPQLSIVEQPQRTTPAKSVVTWKGKTVVSDHSKSAENSGSTMPQRPQRHHSNADLDDMRRRGVCFKCQGKWFRGHVCPNKELQILTVLDDYMVEVIRDESMSEETEVVSAGQQVELSYSSYMGFSSPCTTKLKGIINHGEVTILIDSGATHNFITPTMVKRLQLQDQANANLTIVLGTGVTAQGSGVCKKLNFTVQGWSFVSDFIILELGQVDVILGIYWLRTLGDCKVNWDRRELSFQYQNQQVSLLGEPESAIICGSLRSSSPFDDTEDDVALDTQSCTTENLVDLPSIISTVLQDNEVVFTEPKGLPPSRGHEHAITLLPGVNAVSVRSYRYPHAQKAVMETLIQDMLATGIIRPSRSPFSSPVLLVKKKDQSWRFCVDYRALNQATVPDKFPIPVIDQLLDELHGAHVFSKLDLRAGYHQILMREKDIEKTAFRSADGHYEFLVMPFGLTNAPATFQALMNDIFRPYLRKFVLVFFDDILIYSKSMEEHAEHLSIVLQLLAQHQLFANKKKCLFAQPQVEYLGHIITAAGVSTDPAKTQAMSNWPTPRTVKELRGFLGLTGYYRRFVKGYGATAKPLTELLRKDCFEWNAAAQNAFEVLKQAMTAAPVLALPNFGKAFVVEADASGFGLGAVLMQDKRPIAFFSHGLTPKEQLKSVYERELMAIVLAIQKWKHYLLENRFVVHTDQKSLKFLLEQREVSMEYQKWLIKLLPYNFEILYKAGIDNKVADGLSRISHPVAAVTYMECFAVTVPAVLQLQDIYKEIETDATLQKLIHEDPVSLALRGLTVRDGRLWHKHRLVIPVNSQFIPLILEVFHSSKIGGHSGVLKTLKRIQQSFKWTGMVKAVQKFVAECTVCQTHKTSTLSPAGLLQPLPIPNRIWEDINMDFVEGLPTSFGVNAILVVIDRLSKFGHFVGLRHPFTAADVANKFVQEIVRLHGFPASIVSDRDRIFLSHFWKDSFKLAGTKLKYSTAFHPETDGQSEVLNRCLETYLRCFASAHPRTWSKFLPWAELWYNTSYHTALKTTPFQVVYGREPPSLLPYEAHSTQNFELETMLKERDRMLAHIKEQLLHAQQLMKNNADKHRRDLEFAVGSWVYLKLRPYRQQSVVKRLCQKLAAKFYGPYQVLERVGKAAYRLQLPAGSKIHPVFHISQLKQVLGSHHQVLPMPDSFSDNDELILTPETILDTRYNQQGLLEALVSWRGLPQHESSWENYKDLIRQFPSLSLEDKLVCAGGVLISPIRFT